MSTVYGLLLMTTITTINPHVAQYFVQLHEGLWSTAQFQQPNVHIIRLMVHHAGFRSILPFDASSGVTK